MNTLHSFYRRISPWRRYAFFLLPVLCLTGGAFAPAAYGGAGSTVVKYELDNGLQVILEENHAAPVVAFNMWVKVGSADETDAEAGLAHVQEHMIFKGTKKRGVGEIAREVETAGGDINAYTTFDHTVYYIVMASRYFDRGLDILADAIQNSSFDPAELKKEEQVILEELARSEDSPTDRLGKALFQEAFTKHPYRRPIIGYQETVENFSRNDIVGFYRKWYAPNNMVLVITGDFDSDAVRPQIEQAFRGFRSRRLQRPVKPTEPPQTAPRAVVLNDEVQETYVEMAFHIPEFRHEDTPVLDVLAVLLGSGDSSRLYREVQSKKQLATGVYAYAYTPKDPGIFMVGATVEPDQLKEAAAALLAETFTLKYDTVSARELEKARLNVESDVIYSKETVQGQARKLGAFEVVAGDLAYEDVYYRKVGMVSPADIQDVARQYLTPENVTIGVMLPEEHKDIVSDEDLLALARETDAAVAGKFADATPSADASPVTKITLDNGATLLVKEDHSVPLVAIRAAYLGGGRYLKAKDAGLAMLTARMLTKGTDSRTAAQIAEEVDRLAGSLNGIARMDTIGLGGEFLTPTFHEGLALFMDALLNPAFPEEEIDKQKLEMLAALRQQEDSGARKTIRLFQSTLFGDHPYGLDLLGAPESLERIDRRDLQKYYKKIFRPDNLVLAVVGDVGPDDVEHAISGHLSSGLNPGFKAPDLPRVPPLTDVRTATIEKDREQAHLVLGFPTIPLADPDRYAFEVLNTILAGQGGRLFVELRDHQNLAYSVTSFNIDRLDSGFFAVYMGTRPHNLEDAIVGVKEQLTALITDAPPTDDELTRARQYLIGTYEVDLQRRTAMAATLALNEIMGLGYEEYLHYADNIAQVTRDDVIRVAKKYFTLDKYVLTTMAPPAEETLATGTD